MPKSQSQPQPPPPTPKYILRGHKTQIHALKFTRSNSRLVTGDADGWIVVWDLVTKRAVGVWRGHAGVVLGLGVWIARGQGKGEGEGEGEERVISHGRDGFLRVWQLRPQDEKDFSKTLPIDSKTDVPEDGRYPWLLHSLRIQTVNFCSFDQCLDSLKGTTLNSSTEMSSRKKVPPILIGATARKDDEVEIYRLPSEARHSTVQAPRGVANVGMTMAIRLLDVPDTKILTCITGYESGLTAVHIHDGEENTWKAVYLSRPHTQPILSLDVSLWGKQKVYFTSGADAVLAAHCLPSFLFPSDSQDDNEEDRSKENDEETETEIDPLPTTHESAPLKMIKTGHSGQQGLTVRGDGKVFATAGWDGRMRVYSVKSMREVAVLKWHKEGCYVVGFAEIYDDEGADGDGKMGECGTKVGGEEVSGSGGGDGVALDKDAKGVKNEDGLDVQGSKGIEVISSSTSDITQQPKVRKQLQTVQQQRDYKVRHTHWLAAGSKDGKVSLWDVI